jgi:hypothetical protein
MAYISLVAVEGVQCSAQTIAAITPDHAREAAQILLASAPRHARRFARAMHRRVARGLDVAMIEHWARVVMEVDRMRAALARAA